MDRGTTFTAGIPGRHYTSAMGSKSESESHSVIFDSLRRHGLYSPWNSPGQNTGVGSLSLLQGIFPTQESNQGLLHCRRVLYQLSYEGSPMGSRLTSTGVTSWYNRLSIHLPSVVSLPQTHNHSLTRRKDIRQNHRDRLFHKIPDQDSSRPSRPSETKDIGSRHSPEEPQEAWRPNPEWDPGTNGDRRESYRNLHMRLVPCDVRPGSLVVTSVL